MKVFPIISVAILLTACNIDTPTTPTSPTPSLVKTAKLGSSATMEFGEVTHDVGSPYEPPEFMDHDMSIRSRDKVRPHGVVIPVGGTVTFAIGTFHQVSI